MKRFFFILAIAAAAGLVVAIPAHAQLNPPNELGVTVGHVHLNVRDIDAAQKFFLEIGGKPINARFTGVDYPGVIFRFTKAEPTGSMEGSTINSVGFLVKDGVALMAKLQAEGVKVVGNSKDSQGRVSGGYLYSPDGVKVLITPLPQLSADVQFDQIHFLVGDPGPNGGPAWSELQKWYATTFGVKIQSDKISGGTEPAAQSNLSGVSFKFSKQTGKAAPTQGRALDHIGFEIQNLEAFCKKLEAQGIKFDMPYRTGIGNMGIAYITDPMGTRVELNEGFAVKNL